MRVRAAVFHADHQRIAAIVDEHIVARLAEHHGARALEGDLRLRFHLPGNEPLAFVRT